MAPAFILILADNFDIVIYLAGMNVATAGAVQLRDWRLYPLRPPFHRPGKIR